MNTIVMRGSSLGSVTRWYEEPHHFVRGAHRELPKPMHRRDDNVPYMRPDENDTLEVLAECEKHYGRLTRKQIRGGEVAPCTHNIRCGWTYCP